MPEQHKWEVAFNSITMKSFRNRRVQCQPRNVGMIIYDIRSFLSVTCCQCVNGSFINDFDLQTGFSQRRVFYRKFIVLQVMNIQHHCSYQLIILAALSMTELLEGVHCVRIIICVICCPVCPAKSTILGTQWRVNH